MATATATKLCALIALVRAYCVALLPLMNIQLATLVPVEVAASIIRALVALVTFELTALCLTVTLEGAAVISIVVITSGTPVVPAAMPPYRPTKMATAVLPPSNTPTVAVTASRPLRKRARSNDHH